MPQEKCIGTIIGGSGIGQGNLISGNTSGNLTNPSIGIVLCGLTALIVLFKVILLGLISQALKALPNDVDIYCFGTVSPSNSPIDSTIIGGSSACFLRAINPSPWVSGTATNLNNINTTHGDASPFSAKTQIQMLPLVNVALSLLPCIACIGQQVTLTATLQGTPPFNLLWSDGFSQTVVTSSATRMVTACDSIGNTACNNTYGVTVTDANGFQSSASIRIRVSNCILCKPDILSYMCCLPSA